MIQLSKKDSKFRGYYLIARHYKWALNQVFYHFNYSVAVVVEGMLHTFVGSCLTANKKPFLSVKMFTNFFKMHIVT